MKKYLVGCILVVIVLGSCQNTPPQTTTAEPRGVNNVAYRWG